MTKPDIKMMTLAKDQFERGVALLKAANSVMADDFQFLIDDLTNDIVDLQIDRGDLQSDGCGGACDCHKETMPKSLRS